MTRTLARRMKDICLPYEITADEVESVKRNCTGDVAAVLAKTVNGQLFVGYQPTSEVEIAAQIASGHPEVYRVDIVRGK